MTPARSRLPWILAYALVAIAAGLGMRDAWPPDEPRFALVALEMVEHGRWFFPTVGGVLYPDKPPVFFWAIASLHALGLPLRVAMLLPALFAALVTLVLVHDLARRLWSREVADAAALALALTVQFVVQARTAQIDGFLLGLTTMSLYGLLRHLLAGPAWGWWWAGWAAAGAGTITKGVGFLPLLVLLPWLALARGTVPGTRARWWGGPLAFVAVAGSWLAAVLVLSAGDPALAAYRDEILLRQTAVRYAAAWHHHKPFLYYFTQVLPLLWLPVILLVPWLVPRWCDAWRRRDLRVVLPLVWAVSVLAFFTLSTGKRDVYVLPALPAFVLAAAPWLPELGRRIGVQRALRALLALGAGVVVVVWARLEFVDAGRLAELSETYGLDPGPVLAAAAVVLGLAAAFAGRGRAVAAWAVAALVMWSGMGWWVAPQLDAVRSAAPFMAEVRSHVPAGGELALVGWKEQFVLRAGGPVTHFGFRRRDEEAEFADAAAWLVADPRRRVLVSTRHAGFTHVDRGAAEFIGHRHREDWWLVNSASITR